MESIGWLVGENLGASALANGINSSKNITILSRGAMEKSQMPSFPSRTSMLHATNSCQRVLLNYGLGQSILDY
jgi:hypothetical protein